MINQYKYTENELKKILKSIVILSDTREKENTHILKWFEENEIRHETKKLDTGDYSFYLPKNEEYGIIRDTYFTDQICIERKANVDELVGNFVNDRDRISDEFLRHKGEMILVVENSSYGDLRSGNYRSKYNPKSAVGTLHSLSLKHDVSFIFINKEDTGCFIYCSFYYYLRSIIN